MEGASSRVCLFIGLAVWAVVAAANVAPQPSPVMRKRSEDPLAPIVLVPGLIGSQMRARLTNVKAPNVLCTKTTKDWFTAWLQVDQLVPYYKDCLLHNLALHFTNGTYHNTTGVELDTSVDFGGTEGIEYLDPSLKRESKYFATLVEHFVGLGYVRGKDIHGAPYDWRLAPDAHSLPGGYYDRLQALIEATFERNGNQGVTLVAHSLGCPTSLMFLHSRPSGWSRKYVKAYVPVAGVWGGSVSMTLALVSGYTFGLPQWLFPEDYLKEVQASAASGMFMMPAPASFGSRPIITTPNAAYGAADWATMMADDLQLTQQPAMFAHLVASGLSVQTATLPVPDVNRTAVIYSVGSKTPESLVYDTPFGPGFDEAPSKIVWGAGDDIVNLNSSRRAAVEWKGLAGFSSHMYPNVSHFDTITDKRTLDIIGTAALAGRLPSLLMRRAQEREAAGRPSPADAASLGRRLRGATNLAQAALARKTAAPGSDVDVAVTAMVDEMEEALEEVGEVALVGLASYSLRQLVQQAAGNMEMRP